MGSVGEGGDGELNLPDEISGALLPGVEVVQGEIEALDVLKIQPDSILALPPVLRPISLLEGQEGRKGKEGEGGVEAARRSEEVGLEVGDPEELEARLGGETNLEVEHPEGPAGEVPFHLVGDELPLILGVDFVQDPEEVGLAPDHLLFPQPEGPGTPLAFQEELLEPPLLAAPPGKIVPGVRPSVRVGPAEVEEAAPQVGEERGAPSTGFNPLRKHITRGLMEAFPNLEVKGHFYHFTDALLHDNFNPRFDRKPFRSQNFGKVENWLQLKYK